MPRLVETAPELPAASAPHLPAKRRDRAPALGDLDRAAGHTEQAHEHYQASLDTATALTDLDRDNPAYRQDLGLAHQRFGDLDRAAGHTQQSHEHFQAYLDTATTLTDLDPDNPAYMAMLADAQARLDDQPPSP